MSSEWSFKEHITDYLARPRLGDKKAPTLWPSSASAVVRDGGVDRVVGKCRRANFFRYVTDSFKFYGSKYAHWEPLVEQLEREKVPVDRYMMWIWRAGDLYEEYVIQLSKEAGVFISEQIPLYIPEVNVSGKVDLLIINPKTLKRTNTEIKSVYGFGAKSVVGKPASARLNQVNGEPRESNLMQIAIYDWWHASADAHYENSRLVYGARDTGQYSEYMIRTATDPDTDDDQIHIYYKQIAPFKAPEKKSPITINSILEQYHYIQRCVDGGELPDRDFDLKYSDVKLKQMYEAGDLGKTDRTAYERIQAQKLEAAEIADSETWSDDEFDTVMRDGVRPDGEPSLMHARLTDTQKKTEKSALKTLRAMKPKKALKPLEKGDWQCRFCSHRKTCFDSDKQPRDI